MNLCDVFISASSKDFPFASEVYRFLRGHKLEVFFSEQSLPQHGSADYGKVIDEAIKRTNHMVVVTSSRANVESEWVKFEWGNFINEVRSGRKNGNLVTLLVGGLSPADMPMSLRQHEVLPYNEVGLAKLLSFVVPTEIQKIHEGEITLKKELQTTGTETSFEINLFSAVKIKHTIKKEVK